MRYFSSEKLECHLAQCAISSRAGAHSMPLPRLRRPECAAVRRSADRSLLPKIVGLFMAIGIGQTARAQCPSLAPGGALRATVSTKLNACVLFTLNARETTRLVVEQPEDFELSVSRDGEAAVL